MKVTVRDRKLKNGSISLYLDFYPAIQIPEKNINTRREYLKLYLFDNPKTDNERKHNKETKLKADLICADRLKRINEGNFDFITSLGDLNCFLNFFNEYINGKKNQNSIRNLKSTLSFLQKITNSKLTFNDITEVFVNNLKKKIENLKLKDSTKATYFNIIRTVIHEAYRQNKIKEDILKNIKPIPMPDIPRDHLIQAEINLLIHTDCRNNLVKAACLFCAVTGLRSVDLVRLKWSDLKKDDGSWYAQIVQTKTGEPMVCYIPDNIFKTIGEPKNTDEYMFEILKKESVVTLSIKEWIARAGIKKNITFHNFRHSFATILLTKGADIYTVSKMLGHKDLKTTEVYAKVVNLKKKQAADLLKFDF
jgi:integrase